MLCLSGFELYARWVPLNCPKDRSSFRFLTTTIEKNIYTHCPNGQPEQEQEERKCETKHDSNLCIFACVSG